MKVVLFVGFDKRFEKFIRTTRPKIIRCKKDVGINCTLLLSESSLIQSSLSSTLNKVLRYGKSKKKFETKLFYL